MALKVDDKLRKLLTQADEDFTFLKDSYRDNSAHLIPGCKHMIITEFPGTRYLASNAPENSEAADEFWTLCCTKKSFDLAIALRHEDQEQIYQYWQAGYSSVVTHSRPATQAELTPLARTSKVFQEHFSATMVTLVSGHGKREVLHLYYRRWPDVDVPEHGPLVLELLYSFVKRTSGRVITHCHAGRGRTGVAITYFMLRDAPMLRPRDVVRRLRTSRAHAIHSYEQYRYVRYAFKKFLELSDKKESESESESESSLVTDMAAIDQSPVNIRVLFKALIIKPDNSVHPKQYALTMSSKPWSRRRRFLKRAIKEAESRFGLRVDNTKPVKVGFSKGKDGGVLIEMSATREDFI